MILRHLSNHVLKASFFIYYILCYFNIRSDLGYFLRLNVNIRIEFLILTESVTVWYQIFSVEIEYIFLFFPHDNSFCFKMLYFEAFSPTLLESARQSLKSKKNAVSWVWKIRVVFTRDKKRKKVIKSILNKNTLEKGHSYFSPIFFFLL